MVSMVQSSTKGQARFIIFFYFIIRIAAKVAIYNIYNITIVDIFRAFEIKK